MDWKATLEIIGLIGGLATLIALFLGPMLYLGSKIDNKIESLNTKIDSLRTEVNNDMNEFRKEIKDFHARLSILEERSKT